MKHEIAELLPFYVNDTLDVADRARVDAELAACASCTEELDQLRTLSAALQTRAAAAPPLPPAAVDRALARINTPAVVAATTTLRTAWWGTPARYAAAAALVVGFSGAAVAAWHAREGASSGTSTVASAPAPTAEGANIVYRVTPVPAQPKLNVNVKGASRKIAVPTPAGLAPASQDAAAPSVVKQHRLAKKARLELLVRDVEATLKRAEHTVLGAGGDITTLADQSPSADNVTHTATLQVEVPATRLDDTLDHLALLGAVQNRAIDADDVDAAIVDEEARLRNLRREENDLRALMDKGGKVDEILTVQENLSDVRGQIEQLDAQHANDVHRVATSTIAITLTEDRPSAAPAKPGPSARIDGAWHSGLSALGDTLVAFISTIAWCVAYSPIPLAAAAAAYAAVRLVTRGRTSPA